MRLANSWWLLAFVAACTGTRVTGAVEDEPLCPDFELGAARTKMKGGLRKPVKITVLDGDSLESERIFLGRRSADDPIGRVAFQDDDETYTVQFAQCENVRAPKRVDQGKPDPREASSGYACGEAKIYHETKLEVREGDESSRVLHWVAPPEPACWESEVPTGAASAAASASAVPSATATPSTTAAP